MRAIIIFCLFVVLTFFVGAVIAYPLKLLLDPVLGLAFRKYLDIRHTDQRFDYQRRLFAAIQLTFTQGIWL